MRRLFIGISFFALLSTSFSQNLTIDEKVDSLLNLMTLDEKIGQMTQAERGMLESIDDISYYALGSLLSGGGSSPSPNTQASWANMYNQYQTVALQSRLSIPLIYGVDAVHGHNNVQGAVIFPHNIGLGCTWNPSLVQSVNEITAKEVAATGIDWTFSPCIAVPQNERWGRTYEGFGETAEIHEIMAGPSVIGLQGDLQSSETVLACAKHFVGDGGTENGTDQGNTIINEQELRNKHMAGYIAAIDANVGSVMASYNSWNGQKLHGHDYLLNDILKNELGFEGFVISDWAGVDQVHEDYREAVKRSINAGIDMVMVPDRYIYFISILKSLVQDNEVSQERIDDAVRRILKQKFLLNLFEEPMTDPSLASSFGSQAHRDTARKAVRESLVLLNAKNDVLPLQKNNQRIMVAGSLAKDLGAQCGGWSISWQGSNGAITTGTNILNGIQQVSETSEIIYSEFGNDIENIDVAVVVIGENPYAEGAGDRTSLHLSGTDVNLVKRVKENGIPVVAVLISGRPMIISEIIPYTDAFIAAWLPGTEGDGVAEILFGEEQPSGKLTHSWPKDMSQVPINIGDYNYNPLFAYKHGVLEFPSHNSEETLNPYAAIVPRQGNSILLALSDYITDLSYQNEDFQLRIDNDLMPDIIENVSIADFDESILILELNSSISPTDENLTISYSGNGISSNNIDLEAFQNFYVYNHANTEGLLNIIPGKIEAESFYEMQGIDTEECTDTGGGQNVGWIESGDWMKYDVDIKESGDYTIRSRIAGYGSGSFTLKFDENTETTAQFESTNDWQNWQDFTSNITLAKGNYTMTFTAHNDAFNLNYFDFELVSSVSSLEKNINHIELFPNPIHTGFQLKLSLKNTVYTSIKLYDMSGRFLQSFHDGLIHQGSHILNFQIDSFIKSGIYFIEIKDENHRYFKKVLRD